MGKRILNKAGGLGESLDGVSKRTFGVPIRGFY